MNQRERRQFLIQSLLRERPQYRKMEIPADEDEQHQLLRGLMNVRAPQRIGADFLQVQDDYLQDETAAKGITDLADLTPVQPGLYLWQGDITTLKCDAIVNAANSGMTGCYVPNHRCIDNAIHTFAGVELRLACAELMERQGYPEPTGQAKITPAFNLPCRYVLHTVGPIISGRVTREGQRTAGLLLPFLLGAGSGERAGKRGVLLHLHGRISFSQRIGGRNRRADGQGISEKANQREKGDLQCFQGFGQSASTKSCSEQIERLQSRFAGLRRRG